MKNQRPHDVNARHFLMLIIIALMLSVIGCAPRKLPYVDNRYDITCYFGDTKEVKFIGKELNNYTDGSFYWFTDVATDRLTYVPIAACITVKYPTTIDPLTVERP